jgi:hypothetical protein
LSCALSAEILVPRRGTSGGSIADTLISARGLYRLVTLEVVMAVSIRRRLGAAAVLGAAIAAMAIPVPAQAAPDFVLVFPAGLACDFELEVSGTGGPTVTKEFTDRDGNLVRTLTAGRGTALTFRNVSTDATVSLKGNGSVINTNIHADGSSTVQSTGHNVLILFPTDIPAGPTTTLYIGRVTYDVTGGVFSITGSSGQTRDICAELGQ